MARGTMHAPKPDGQRQRRNAPTRGETVPRDGKVRGPKLSELTAVRAFARDGHMVRNLEPLAAGLRVRGDRMASPGDAVADRGRLLAHTRRRPSACLQTEPPPRRTRPPARPSVHLRRRLVPTPLG